MGHLRLPPQMHFVESAWKCHSNELYMSLNISSHLSWGGCTKNCLLSTCENKHFVLSFRRKLTQGGLEGDRERAILLYWIQKPTVVTVGLCCFSVCEHRGVESFWAFQKKWQWLGVENICRETPVAHGRGAPCWPSQFEKIQGRSFHSSPLS